ncbi:hypothetical protein ACFQS1_05670 [Paractinoplanes rhizophilus]|uniref:Uncharacterized protein n=1 Tax=Paractinoplanes rhizophilus TaxID=1416877 RepID=A0ABW2HJP7_9ACTN
MLFADFFASSGLITEAIGNQPHDANRPVTVDGERLAAESANGTQM